MGRRQSVRYGSPWCRVPRKAGKGLCEVCGEPLRFRRPVEHRECVRQAQAALNAQRPKPIDRLGGDAA